MTHIRHRLGLVISSMALATALVAIGCGSSGGGGTGGAGGGNNGAGGATGAGGSATGACAARPDLIAASPACDNVANTATAIGFTALTGAAPAPAGGTVLDGLYQSTKTGAYGATTGGGRRISFVMTTLTGGIRHMLWNGEVLDATGTNVTTSFKADATVTIAGTQITNSTINCGAPSPPPLPAAFDYTVSGADLILSLPANGATAATTYTRRGCAP
jgi:hypothetical protein